MPKPTEHDVALAEAIQNLCQVFANAIPDQIPQVVKACELADSVISWAGDDEEEADSKKAAELLLFKEEFDKLYVVWKGRPHDTRKVAFKNYCARRRSGVGHKILEDATRNYWRHCTTQGNLATDKMMMAQTFFGTSERWCEFVKEHEAEPTKANQPLGKL